MWTRSQLKSNAKLVLKQSYWKTLLVSFILSMVTGGGSGFSAGLSADEIDFDAITSGIDPEIVLAAVIGIITVVLGVIIFSTAFSIFAGAPIEVGAQRYFLESTQYRFNVKELAYAFGCGHYGNVVVTMFLRGLYTTLWTFLFIIPGIVKSYSYSLVPFILAENPSLSPNQAITLSRKMTRGHKWNMFILDVSFWGWYLLGAMLFFVGMLFVTPYYNSTRAQLYLALRSNAIDKGIVSLEELEGNR